MKFFAPVASVVMPGLDPGIHAVTFKLDQR
jgi:hypothetical protein